MYFDDDIFYPFITDIQNVERGWLVRYYDNNYFVRNIVIKSKISLKTTRPWFTEKIGVYQKLSDLGFSEYIVALPGPLTIANHSIDEARVYASKSQIMIDYARIIAEITESYINNGIRVELHEPELCFTSQLTNELIRQIYVDLFSPLGEKVHLVTYFGVPNLEILNLLPRDLTLGVEAISLEKTREIFDKLKDFSSIRLGIVDSRNTKMEKIDDLISLVFKLEDKGIHIKYLSFNSMTEFLPEVIAYKKIKLLKRVVEAIKH
ncbi:MAG: hypothetical protein LM588_03360 [Fervidicoccaceae archaeon]|nr:hypothetical protein [Fervidicoccaceae archaeon]